MAHVYVDIDNYLDAASTDALRCELRRRRELLEDNPNEPHEWTPSGLADDLRTAFYARNASRFEALLCVLQPHEATRGLKQRRDA